MRVIGLAFAAALLAGPASAQTPSDARGPELPVRVWTADGGGNIRLELPEAIMHETRMAGDRITLRFAQPVRTDLVAVMKGLPDYVRWAEAGADGRTFTFRLKQPVRLRESTNGGVVLLQLAPEADGPAVAEQTVRVRTGVHPGYSRIVFDWPDLVAYEASQTPDGLRLSFDAAARFDLGQAGGPAQALRVLPPADGKSAVVVTVPGGSEATHFRLGNRVVVDIARRGDGPAAVARAEPSAAPAPPPRTPAPARSSANEPTPPLPRARPDGRDVPAVPPAAAAPVAAPPAAAPAPPVAIVRAPSTPPRPAPTTPAPIPTPAPAPKAEPAPEPAKPARPAPPPAVAAAPATPVAPEPVRPSPARPPAQATPAPATPVPAEGGAPVQVSRGESRLRMAFPGTAGARAAVFRRAGQVWVVFDRALRLDLAPVRAGAVDLVPTIEQQPKRDATVIRIVPSPGLEPAVDRDAAGWAVTLSPQQTGPERTFDVRVEAAPQGGSRVVIPVDSAGPVVEVTDPDAGDRLLIVPVGPVHLGVAGARNYPEFSLLPSPQGIAIGARTERLRVNAGPSAVEITTGRGLLLENAVVSPLGTPAAPAPPERRTEVDTGPPLFEFARWSRAGRPFNDVRAELQRAITTAPPLDRNPVRLELARFLLARGFAAEALGLLRLVSDDAPAIATRPQFLGMRAAAQTLSGRDEEARADFGDPVLAGEAEAALWRGLLLAHDQRWSEAAQRFRAGRRFVDTYPDWLRGKFALAGTEAAVETGDARMADDWLNLLVDARLEEPTRSRADYLRARMLLADGSLDAGREAMTRAAAGGDRLTRARAGLALVELGLADGTMTHDQAIAELERLRFAWRGDTLEYEVLARLGQAYLDAGKHWEGLTVLRNALSVFPEGDKTAALTERMTNAFRAIFSEGTATDLSPLKAMALYEEFRELTPSGADGEKILRSLAGRLVALDLFEPAATILDDLVRNRLTGAARGRAAADLALVHLLDNKPQTAIAALDLVRADDSGATIRRRHLRARALADLGRPAEAIRLLSGDSSREAYTLAADMHWRATDWPRAAAAYRQLLSGVEASAALEDDDARLVLRLAVSETLAGNKAGARELAAKYGRAIAATQHGPAFALVVSGTEAQPGIDKIAAALAGADDFKSQLKAYREALEKPAEGKGAS